MVYRYHDAGNVIEKNSMLHIYARDRELILLLINELILLLINVKLLNSK